MNSNDPMSRMGQEPLPIEHRVLIDGKVALTRWCTRALWHPNGQFQLKFNVDLPLRFSASMQVGVIATEWKIGDGPWKPDDRDMQHEAAIVMQYMALNYLAEYKMPEPRSCVRARVVSHIFWSMVIFGWAVIVDLVVGYVVPITAVAMVCLCIGSAIVGRFISSYFHPRQS